LFCILIFDVIYYIYILFAYNFSVQI
jgi:hypothetical protein